jgi:hypothetical protein
VEGLPKLAGDGVPFLSHIRMRGVGDGRTWEGVPVKEDDAGNPPFISESGPHTLRGAILRVRSPEVWAAAWGGRGTVL